MDKAEMHKMLEEMASQHPEMPRAVQLVIQYDETLSKITGRSEEPMFMGEGGTFVYLLQNVFMAYPQIERRYSPGTIGFFVNGVPPRPHSPLFDGDIVSFVVAGS